MRRHGSRSLAVLLLALVREPGRARPRAGRRRAPPRAATRSGAQLETIRERTSSACKALSDRLEQLETARPPAPPARPATGARRRVCRAGAVAARGRPRAPARRRGEPSLARDADAAPALRAVPARPRAALRHRGQRRLRHRLHLPDPGATTATAPSPAARTASFPARSSSASSGASTPTPARWCGSQRGRGARRPRALAAASRVRLDEANLTLLTLPLGTTARLGLMRPRFGTLNAGAPGRPAADRPAQRAEPVLRSRSSSTARRASRPSGCCRCPSTTSSRSAPSTATTRWPSAAARCGIPWSSVAGERSSSSRSRAACRSTSRPRAESRPTRIATPSLGLGAKYKWAAPGSGFPLFTLAGEALYAMRTVTTTAMTSRPAGPPPRPLGRLPLRAVRPQPPLGGSACAATGPSWRSSAGASGPLSPYLQFKPSEFLRFRVQYKHTEGTGAVERVANEVFLQGTFILGAHPTERF